MTNKQKLAEKYAKPYAYSQLDRYAVIVEAYKNGFEAGQLGLLELRKRIEIERDKAKQNRIQHRRLMESGSQMADNYYKGIEYGCNLFLELISEIWKDSE